VHPKLPPFHVDQFDLPHEPLGLLHVPLMTVMTENKLKTNHQPPEQPPVHADQFYLPYEPLELLHVAVLLHVVDVEDGGHGVHGLHPDQLHVRLIRLSAYRTTSNSC
jgi:hypothetical protein